MDVFLAMVIHAHEPVFFVNATEAGRTSALAEWCREHWPAEMDDTPPDDDDDKTTFRYFEGTYDSLWMPDGTVQVEA